MRLKPKPKIRPGGATREKNSVQPSVDDIEKTASTPSSVTTDSVVITSCDSQGKASNCGSVETGPTCLASADNDSSGSSDVTLQTCNTSSTSNTSSSVSISSANVTSLSDCVTISSCKPSSNSCVTTMSTSIVSSTRPTSLSMITSLTTANFNSGIDSPVSRSSSDVLTDLFNDDELPNMVQAESVLICEDNNNLDVDDGNSEDDNDEEPSTECHYPSFVESLSHIMSSHKALGLEQPADGEVQSSAVEGTLRQRCDELDDNDDMTGDGVNDDGENVVEGTAVEETADKQSDDLPYVPEEEATNKTTNKKQPKPKKKLPAPKRKRKTLESTEEQVKKRKKTIEQGAKSNSKQTVFEAPDRSKMTMSDLTSYNPSANPMKSALEKRKKRRQNGTNRKDGDESTAGSSQSSSQKDKSPDVEVMNEESARLVPQLTVGEDGQIILNEKSLTVEATQTEREMDSEVVFESSNSYTTSHQFSRKSFYTKSWNKEETDKFYETLSKTGTDFTLMTLWIPNRSRMELKRKFKREEKRNPIRINQALKTNVPLFEHQPANSNDKVNT